MNRLVAALLAAATVARAAVAAGESPEAAGGYDRELGIRLLFSASNPSMFHARLAIRDDNAATVAAGTWTGGVSDNALGRALGGGLEASWGVLPDLRLLAAIEGRGAAATGSFTGAGANTKTDPVLGLQRQMLDRTARYPALGEELGVTVLLRDLGWCRLGLTARAGVWELADAHEEGTETGPLRTFAWARNLSATAPGGLLGLEWEWTPGPVAAFVSFGYRELIFRDVRYDRSDSAGVQTSGDYKFPDDTRFQLDFSGPELRLGVEALLALPAPL